MSSCTPVFSFSDASAAFGAYGESRSGRVRRPTEKVKEYWAQSGIHLDEAEDDKKGKKAAKKDLERIFSFSAVPATSATATVGAPPIPVVTRLLSGVDDDVRMAAAGAASGVEETRSLTPTLIAAGLLVTDDEKMKGSDRAVTPPLTPLLVSASKISSSVLSKDDKEKFFSPDHLEIIDKRYEKKAKDRSFTGPFDRIFTEKK